MQQTILTILTSIAATGLLGYLFGFKKMKADTRKTELDSIEQAVRIWREMSASLKQDFDRLQAKYDALLKAHIEMENRVSELTRENHALKAQLDIYLQLPTPDKKNNA